ncbi:MAG: S9 family peptidase [Anaerolineales bacterium]|nr:S9 family peptidase [Anaerolineales bacterium]
MLPPLAPTHPHPLTLHGHTRVDPYYWLRDKSDPATLAYLTAENTYMEAVMAHTKPLQETLYQEMVGRIQETDVEVPVKKGPYFYYTRTEAGKQYPLFCRKKDNLDAPEEITLDLNQLAEGKDFLKLGVYKVSPDHQWLAYSLDEDGSELFTIHFKNLTTGEVLPTRIPNTTYTGEWANDNVTYFYTTLDAAKRPYRLHRYSFATGHTLLFQEDDPVFLVSLEKTRDDAYLFLNVGSIETSEIYFLSADTPEGDFHVIHPRQKGLEYKVSHHTGTFYLVTNDQAKNFKVMTAPATRPSKDNWTELIPHRAEVRIDGVDLFAGHLVVYQRENGLRTIHITDFATEESHAVTFPEPAYTYFEGDNPEFDTPLVRFTYESMTTPDTVYDYNMTTREMTLKKRKPVQGGFDPNNYQAERLMAPAQDGTLIPISLVYRKGFTRDGNAPCLLYGYGSYGASMDPYFLINAISLLDRGFVYAIAHIRGGEEMGRAWYENGKFLHKKNTFTDFIDCGRYLIAERYTASERMAIMGRSAGGLLIGAVINLAPDLAKVAFAGVPFVDVITTMLDTTIPLTAGEFEEWGNPQNEEYYWYMLSYSPYDNVEAKDYPHLLVTSGLNDPRVQYFEPTKWVAKLRAMKTDNNRLLLKTNMGAGHAGASGRYDYLREIAFDYAFIIDSLGVGREGQRSK